MTEHLMAQKKAAGQGGQKENTKDNLQANSQMSNNHLLVLIYYDKFDFTFETVFYLGVKSRDLQAAAHDWLKRYFPKYAKVNILNYYHDAFFVLREDYLQNLMAFKAETSTSDRDFGRWLRKLANHKRDVMRLHDFFLDGWGKRP